MKAYGFKCKKCDSLVADTPSSFLVYAKNVKAAVELLQDSIKEHDLAQHGDDQQFLSFQIVAFFNPKE